MDKKIKKWMQVVALLMCVPVICTMLYARSPQREASSAMREYTSETVLILENEIPLGLAENASICMQALRLINDYRQENGLQPLLWNTELEAAAAVRAEEAKTCWSHTRPNGQPWYTVNASIMFGENLGRGYSDAASLVQAWKDSPAHNENLLFADFKYAAISGTSGTYALEFA